jgi:hypothetical protein
MLVRAGYVPGIGVKVAQDNTGTRVLTLLSTIRKSRANSKC